MRRVRRRNFENIRFEDFCRAAEYYGFEFRRIAGSHHIYRHPDVPTQLSLQPSHDGTAKGYQLRQFLNLVERYRLIPRIDRDDP